MQHLIEKMLKKYQNAGNGRDHKIEIVDYFGKYFLYVTGNIYACFDQRMLFCAPYNWDNSRAVKGCTLLGPKLNEKAVNTGFFIFELETHVPKKTEQQFMEFSQEFAKANPEIGHVGSFEHVIAFTAIGAIADGMNDFVKEEAEDDDVNDDFGEIDPWVINYVDNVISSLKEYVEEMEEA